MKIYNKEGKQIGGKEWGELLNDRSYSTIKQEDLPDGCYISTVWLGLDHRFSIGEPLIFETMVFDREDKEVEMQRYTTLEEAELGHILIAKRHLGEKGRHDNLNS